MPSTAPIPALPRLSSALLSGALSFSALIAATPAALAQNVALPSVTLVGRQAGQPVAREGSVEALRQTVIAAQVSGTVVAVTVKAGDRVRAGQVLLRLDARAAEQQAGAASAQVQAARAAQEAATTEWQRQQQLFQKQYISRAALERAEAQYKTTTAQTAAQVAAAGAARTEAGYAVVRAPYDGVVAEVPVVEGDMAQPGRALLTVFDPAALRVAVAVPESMAGALPPGTPFTQAVEIAGQAGALTPSRWQLLPAADAATHTVLLRLELPRGTVAAPGQFARVWLPAAAAAEERVFVPTRAVLRRAELQAVYVLNADGKPLLRQVRLGPVSGEQVEVLAGLKAGERVVLEPQAAARQR
jgi:RND family efflux transporter MFP subunit